MNDDDPRVNVAVREANYFRKQLDRRLMGGQVIMVIVLSTMAYFDVALKWMIVLGFFLAVGILSDLIEEVGSRLDAGRSYLEQWSRDAEELLERR
jgi:hypothetical protein